MENTDQNNAVNEDLKDIQKMVDVVKQDGEVSLQYMKSFEHDQLMYEEGRLAEIKNTEREKKRADMAQSRIKELEAELKKYRKRSSLVTEYIPGQKFINLLPFLLIGIENKCPS